MAGINPLLEKAKKVQSTQYLTDLMHIGEYRLKIKTATIKQGQRSIIFASDLEVIEAIADKPYKKGASVAYIRSLEDKDNMGLKSMYLFLAAAFDLSFETVQETVVKSMEKDPTCTELNDFLAESVGREVFVVTKAVTTKKGETIGNASFAAV
jgi:hypothetical protein